MKTNAEKLLDIALEALDTEVTPNDNVPDEVACAEVISTLLNKLFPDFPILASTKDLDMKLFTDKRFDRIGEPERGAIVISPRTSSTYGHCGVFITSEKIASNNSFGKLKGKFTGNYLWSEWIDEFRYERGLRIYIYRLK